MDSQLGHIIRAKYIIRISKGYNFSQFTDIVD